MNREILFRGFHECKDGTQKAYYGGAWHHGDWIKGDLLMSIDGSGNVVFTCIMTQEMTAYSKHVNRETVGEYTGLPDKNGVMMFEGDLVIIDGFKDTPARIVFEDFGWICLIPEFGYYRHRLENDSKKYEVIGNIYDREACDREACDRRFPSWLKPLLCREGKK